MKRCSFCIGIVFILFISTISIVSAVEHKTKSNGKSEIPVVFYPGTLQQGMISSGRFWQPNPFFQLPKKTGKIIIPKLSIPH